jgi:hypothetical protein
MLTRAGTPRVSVITRERVPRPQLDESQMGVPPESTTIETNRGPRLTWHDWLLLETAPMVKFTGMPDPYWDREEWRASATAPLAQACCPAPGTGAVPVCWSLPGEGEAPAPGEAGAVLALGDGADGCGFARCRERRAAVSLARSCRSPRPAAARAAEPPARDPDDPWPAAGLPPSTTLTAAFAAQTSRVSTAMPPPKTTTRRRQ